MFLKTSKKTSVFYSLDYTVNHDDVIRATIIHRINRINFSFDMKLARYEKFIFCFSGDFYKYRQNFHLKREIGR